MITRQSSFPRLARILPLLVSVVLATSGAGCVHSSRSEAAVPEPALRLESERELVAGGEVPAGDVFIFGRLVDGANGRPIAGALVWVGALNAGTRSDSDGRWRLQIPAARVPGTAVALVVQADGYAGEHVAITLRPGHRYQFAGLLRAERASPARQPSRPADARRMRVSPRW